MNKKYFTDKWYNLSISCKFRFAFGILLALILMVSITGYGALTIVHYKTESIILNSTTLRRLVLEMNTHLEEARRFERDFFLKYPIIGFSEARQVYAEKTQEHISEVISLSSNLKHLISQSHASNALRESDVNLNFFLFAANRYAKSFQESVSLVAKLASDKTGLYSRLADYSACLLKSLDIDNNLELLALFREMKLYEKDYLLTKKRPFMQSAFNTGFLLNKAVIKTFPENNTNRIQKLQCLDLYIKTAQEILSLDNEILRKTREFDLQADAIDPIAEELVKHAQEDVEHARRQIVDIKQVSGNFLIITALTGLLLTIMIARIFNNSITKNIISLTEAARELQTGNIEIYAAVKSGDEIGQLAKTFNTMAHRINFLISDLENKVTNRTAELTKINIQLQKEVLERKQAEESMKKAKEEAEQANSTKSEFLANMSHEIRTPMNSILGFSEILENQIQDRQLKQYLAAISASGNTLLNLINDILDLSKIEAGKLKLEYSVIGLYSIFKEIEQIFTRKIEEKGLKFIIEMDKKLPKAIILDGIRLRQVLLNLVGNAVKFTHSGYIRLSADANYPRDDHSSFKLIINVEDTGIGIPEQELDAIFDAFVQQTGQKEGQYGGTGLGLSITKRLVKMMGGSIFVKSEINKGSSFVVVIKDVEVAAGRNEIKQDKIHTNIDNIKLDATILAVDDIDDNRQLIKGYLLPNKVNIIEAVNGVEAIKMAKKFKPDIILMDIKMPVMNGYEAIKRIRQDKTTAHIPIIAVTASAMKDSEDRIRSLCDSYLRKPVSRIDLINELARFLKPDPLPVIHEIKNPDLTLKSEKLRLDTMKDISTLTQKLQEDVYNTWKELRDTLSINDIERFAVKLKKMGTDFACLPLIQWAEKLESQAAIYDVDALQKTLEGFVELLEEIKSLKQY
ncbi:Signal transduction response regulator, receiver domain histidine kinase [Desulfonema limicola]|uniref:histidine kinase n=1 Tax=Desulfonema limicola TaxID=45656 RepID=A0A975B3J0_9BACT|nr:ATP-binding protein [Desulfonema limicola]QTA78140.1 Signal transduction response regulator, receiver domain histidine kinase [Desulfonema limicola]